MPYERPARAEPTWIRWLGDAVDCAVIALGCALTALMIANVAGRALFNSDISANVELGEFMLVWATFLGGVSAARRGTHMRITELVMALPRGAQRLLELATRVLVVAILVVLAWNGALIANANMGQTTTVLYWPVGLMYAAMPVGSALSAIFVAYETVLIFRGATAPDISES